MRVLILLIFVATAAYASQEECGENAHFVECGFACPLTCENYKKPPSMCALKCATGCHCDKGFIKAANGSCVRPEECPASMQEQECGANAHFESCGTACPLTCENYKNPPKVCVLRCDIGCQCDKGFVKADDGSCVKPEECPASVQEQECGANAHFESCGTACPLTCENYKNPPKACVLRCDIGCQCDKGFVKAADGSCVRPEECPASVQEQECGANAHFESCGTACPLTCENYKNPPIACNFMCDIGCHCDKGYVKAADGSCVRPEQCPASGPEPAVKNCVDEPEAGSCYAYFPMWYYDGFTQKCHKFIYGGCGGNGNRYNNEEECMKNCQGIVAEEETGTNTCDMPAETGVCRGFFPRFYFDRISGTCEKFIYGGCGGNENNFETIEECQSTCGRAAPSACLEEKKVGPCKAGFPRFYFNKETGQCEKFLYGGCLGNSNNFMTQEDCEAVCKA